MDDIADRAGVSKPVLYQHFPGKLDLYLALLDASCDTIIANCRAALESTHDNKQRVEATMDVFYDYVASDTGAFRLVFESDLTNEPAVREHVERVTTECAAMIAEVIHEDTGLPDEASRLLAVSLVGMAQVSARFWLTEAGGINRADAAALVAGLGVARHPRLPADRRALSAHSAHNRRGSTSVEVKIGIQHAPRELIVDTDETAEDDREAGRRGGRLRGRAHPHRHARAAGTSYPASKVAYVEIGGGRRSGRLPQLSDVRDGRARHGHLDHPVGLDRRHGRSGSSASGSRPASGTSRCG